MACRIDKDIGEREITMQRIDEQISLNMQSAYGVTASNRDFYVPKTSEKLTISKIT